MSGAGRTADSNGTAEPRDLLQDLVAIPSVSGSESACAERLVAYLEGQGREAWTDDVGNVRAPADDGVLLTSHLDTVPGDIEVRVAPGEDGRPALWGRGSVDAKGSLAAMAVAAVRTGASFAGVVGEETDSRGARHLIADRDPPGAVVNGEPSGWDAVTLGYRGFLAGTYEVSTEGRHTSRPDPNALQDAMAWWNGVEAAVQSSESESTVESVTPKPVEMVGGTTEEGHEVTATVDFELRVPPDRSLDGVRETVAGVDGEGSIDWHDERSVPPQFARPRTSLGAAFRRAIRAEGGDPGLLRKTGTADSNHYADAWDCPVVSYGPGDSDLDHAPDEHLPLAAFDRAIAVLEAVADDLVGEG